MKENNYRKNVIFGLLFDILGMFFLGVVFSSMAFALFCENYKNSLDNISKRKESIIGKAFSIFVFCSSSAYHGQASLSIDDRIRVAIIVGFICFVVALIIMGIKDKKIVVNSNNKNSILNNDIINLHNSDSYKDVSSDKSSINKKNFKKTNIVHSNKSKKKSDDYNIDSKYSDLFKLKDLLDKEIITKEEFDKEKEKILK